MGFIRALYYTGTMMANLFWYEVAYLKRSYGKGQLPLNTARRYCGPTEPTSTPVIPQDHYIPQDRRTRQQPQQDRRILRALTQDFFRPKLSHSPRFNTCFHSKSSRKIFFTFLVPHQRGKAMPVLVKETPFIFSKPFKMPTQKAEDEPRPEFFGKSAWK